jgi:hypothetical protein
VPAALLARSVNPTLESTLPVVGRGWQKARCAKNNPGNKNRHDPVYPGHPDFIAENAALDCPDKPGNDGGGTVESVARPEP